MARPAVHSTDDILDAARGLVLDGGARAATVNAIAAASGAPKGSIYHRFATLEDLLAAMWLRAARQAQERSLGAMRGEDAIEDAVAAGLALHDFARAAPGDARLLASVRREDLVAKVGDPALERALREVNDAFGAAVADLAARLYGRRSRAAVEQTLCAMSDLPLGALRRHLVAGRPLPRTLRAQLEAAIRAALAQPRGRTP